VGDKRVHRRGQSRRYANRARRELEAHIQLHARCRFDAPAHLASLIASAFALH